MKCTPNLKPQTFKKDRWDLVPLLRRREISLDQIRFAVEGRLITRQAVANFIAGRNNSPRVAAAIAAVTGLPLDDVLMGRAA